MPLESTVERLLRRDRLVVIAGLSVVFVVSAIYTVRGVGMGMSAITMTRMAIDIPGMAMQPVEWTPSYAVLVFLMWWIMMIAMMLPSAAPMVLLHIALRRKRAPQVGTVSGSAFFIAGYLAVWAGFSLLATLLQWTLERVGVLTGMMEIASPVLAGSVLMAAGLYQFTPLKYACLHHCRSPVSFIMHHWRPGDAGAWRMGLAHGVYCLGCCWFLMALLFVGGIMNLIWIAGIAVYVGFEKFAGRYRWLTNAAGVVLAVAGVLAIMSSQWPGQL